MMSRNVFEDLFIFVVLFYGICLKGRLNEWRNIIICNLNEEKIYIVIRYLKLLDIYLFDGILFEVLFILY